MNGNANRVRRDGGAGRGACVVVGEDTLRQGRSWIPEDEETPMSTVGLIFIGFIIGMVSAYVIDYTAELFFRWLERRNRDG